MISCEKTYDSLGFAFTISIFDHIGRTQDIRYVCFHSRYAHVLHVGHSFENGSHSHRFVYYMPRSNWHASSQESCSWTAVTWIQRQTFAASSGLTGKHQHGPHVCAKTLAIHLPLDGFCRYLVCSTSNCESKCLKISFSYETHIQYHQERGLEETILYVLFFYSRKSSLSVR
jgi:hypothetical protein